MWRNLLIKFGISTKITSLPAAGPKSQAARQYLLSPKQIVHLFTDLQINQQFISLQFSKDATPLLHSVQIIHLDPKKKQFLIHLPALPVTDVKHSGSNFSLTLPYRNATLTCSSEIHSELMWDAKLCYLANIPERILSTEMRCFARVRLNPMHGVNASIYINQNDLLNSPIENICENGFRISIHQTFDLKPNDVVQARIQIPEFGTLKLKAINS